jgi:hypothetical protein
MVRNKAGDSVFISKDNVRRRFDFNNTHGDQVHMHIEVKIKKWGQA